MANYKKVLSLLAAAALICSLVGCQADVVTGHGELINSESSQITTIAEQTGLISNVDEISETAIYQSDIETDDLDVNSQSTINRLIFNKIYSDGSNNAVTVNGISLKSSKNQVIKRFGEPDFVPNYVGEDYCYVYYEANTENKLLTINFDNDDNVILIDINLNN